jgi:hypothetical protein
MKKGLPCTPCQSAQRTSTVKPSPSVTPQLPNLMPARLSATMIWRLENAERYSCGGQQ